MRTVPVQQTSALPPPLPPLFSGFWPAPAATGATAALLATVVGGVAAAICLPLGQPGIGCFLIGLFIAGALAVVSYRDGEKVRLGQLLWAATALVLLAVCALRAAPWLGALCMITAAGAGLLAVTDGRSARDFALAVVALPIAALRALPWATRGIRAFGSITTIVRMLVAVLVTILLVAIFGALFAGADDNFAALVQAVVPEPDVATLFRWTFVLVSFALGTLGAAFILLRPPKRTVTDGTGHTTGKALRRWEWALPIGVLVVLFAVFIVVQAAPMFGGAAHVRQTADLTFADYARSGFWQLTWVTILTLPVIGAAVRWAPRDTAFERNLLRALAGLLAVLTLCIVASALIRMQAYQAAYGYTVLRLLVLTCELWLAVVYLMIIAAGVRLRAAWLPTAAVATAVAALLILAALNPEGFIAERNIDRFEATGRIDLEYLDNLSTDAIPALQRLPADQRASVRSSILTNMGGTDWQSWNLSDQLNAGT